MVLLRSDHTTHSLTTGDRYVKLAFKQKGAAQKGEPKLPGQAVPGIYMLFRFGPIGGTEPGEPRYVQ